MPSYPTVSRCPQSSSVRPPARPRARTSTLGRPGVDSSTSASRPAARAHPATNAAISGSPAPPATSAGLTESMATSAASSSAGSSTGRRMAGRRSVPGEPAAAVAAPRLLGGGRGRRHRQRDGGAARRVRRGGTQRFARQGTGGHQGGGRVEHEGLLGEGSLPERSPAARPYSICRGAGGSDLPGAAMWPPGCNDTLSGPRLRVRQGNDRRHRMGTGTVEAEETTALALAEKQKLVKSLRRLDMIGFTVCALVGLDTLGTVASNGAQGFTWLIVLALLFVVPYALLMCEVGSAFRQEGGPYVWVKMAFGRRQAAIAAVLYWVTNPLWVGGSLAFTATAAWNDNLFNVGAGGSFGDYLFKFLFIWLSIGVAIVSLKRGKWIPNVGALMRVIVLGFFTITLIVYA